MQNIAGRIPALSRGSGFPHTKPIQTNIKTLEDMGRQSIGSAVLSETKVGSE